MKVPMTLEQMRELHQMALRLGTLEAWADVAMQWMDASAQGVHRLREQVERTVRPGTPML